MRKSWYTQAPGKSGPPNLTAGASAAPLEGGWRVAGARAPRGSLPWPGLVSIVRLALRSGLVDQHHGQVLLLALSHHDHVDLLARLDTGYDPLHVGAIFDRPV